MLAFGLALSLLQGAAVPAAGDVVDRERVRDRRGNEVLRLVRVERAGDDVVEKALVVSGLDRDDLTFRCRREKVVGKGAAAYEVRLGSGQAIRVTKPGGDAPIVVSAGEAVYRFVAQDARSRTVRCRLASLADDVDPRLMRVLAELVSTASAVAFAEEAWPVRLLLPSGAVEPPRDVPRGPESVPEEAEGFAALVSEAKALLPFDAGAEPAGSARERSPGDYFELLRAKTFVEVDRSYVARSPREPASVRLRHLLLRVRLPGVESTWWWKRDLLLVTMPSGRRYVTEVSFVYDLRHPGAETPLHRLSSARAVVETWSVPDPEEKPEESLHDARTVDGGDRPCKGLRQLTVGGERSTLYYVFDLDRRTVRQSLLDVRDAALSPEEVEELRLLRRLQAPGKGGDADTLGSILAASLLLVDRPVPPRRERDLVLAPDDAVPGDLAPWRALTYLPLDLPLFTEKPEDVFP